MKEYLDSDRVNFLIWRYLVEGNYRETAVKLQKEWRVAEPHRDFDFASHVKSHALVHLINKGLIYGELERQYAETKQVPQDAEAAGAMAAAMQVGVFGPLEARPSPYPPLLQRQLEQQNQPSSDAPSRSEETRGAQPAPPTPATAPSTAGGEQENSRKRPIDRQQQQPLTNGGSRSPASKRPRLSNGYENGNANGGANGSGVDAATTPMEIDSQDNHAYPSPLEGEQATSPVPRTDGPEQGTQIEKVEELTTDTTFVPLGPTPAVDETPRDAAANGSTPPSAAAAASGTAPPASRANSDRAPILLHCQWNPRDPNILAAAGTDALARIWTVSRGPPADPAPGHVNGTAGPPPGSAGAGPGASRPGAEDPIGVHPQFHSLIDDEIPPKATVTAMAWNSDGTVIAVATDSDEKGRLTLWSAEGSHLHHFEVPEPPIIKIVWNPNNTAILGIVPDSETGGSLITVYHAATANTMTHYLARHDLQQEPLDAAWTSDNEFMVCGGELLATLRCTDTGIVEGQKFETREGDNLTKVQFDTKASLAATCGDKGFIDIWNAEGKRREISAHVDSVTALAWQPLRGPSTPGERLLASGGDDGAIFVWDALAADAKPKCSMTMGLPIVALAFTPDGAFLAGATSEKILIWKVGDHGIPRASWSRAPHPGWLSPRINPESDEEDEHCLAWDSTGQKLAYGVNSRLAVINFR